MAVALYRKDGIDDIGIIYLIIYIIFSTSYRVYSKFCRKILIISSLIRYFKVSTAVVCGGGGGKGGSCPPGIFGTYL